MGGLVVYMPQTGVRDNGLLSVPRRGGSVKEATMPDDKQNALEALDQARTLVGDGPVLDLRGVRLVQLRSFLERSDPDV